MSGPLRIATIHADIALRLRGATWTAECPMCEWVSRPHQLLAAAIRDADLHSDDAVARGLEDPEGARMPPPVNPGARR